MVLLDTNLLIYACNTASPFHKKAKEIKEQAVDGKIKTAIALQSLSEYLAVTTSSRRVEKPLSVVEAVDDVRHFLEASQIRKLPITEITAKHLSTLVNKYRIKAQTIFDAQIVAVMLENEMSEIWTANDGDFSIFKGISVVNPF